MLAGWSGSSDTVVHLMRAFIRKHIITQLPLLCSLMCCVSGCFFCTAAAHLLHDFIKAVLENLLAWHSSCLMPLALPPAIVGSLHCILHAEGITSV